MFEKKREREGKGEEGAWEERTWRRKDEEVLPNRKAQGRS